MLYSNNLVNPIGALFRPFGFGCFNLFCIFLHFNNRLCDSGVATKDSIGLSGTGKTAFVISEGGAKYIYEREQEDINTRALENESLKLSVAEMKRNKVAFWLTILNSIILLPTVFKMVKALILYLSNLF